MTDEAYCDSLRKKMEQLQASLDHRTLVMGAAMQRAEKAEARVKELETALSNWDALFMWGDDFAGYDEELALHRALHRTGTEPATFREGSPTHRCRVCKKVNRGDEVACFGDYATCSTACADIWLDAVVGQGRRIEALRAEIAQLKQAPTGKT